MTKFLGLYFCSSYKILFWYQCICLPFCVHKCLLHTNTLNFWMLLYLARFNTAITFLTN
jgi:hypothetical protein